MRSRSLFFSRILYRCERWWSWGMQRKLFGCTVNSVMRVKIVIKLRVQKIAKKSRTPKARVLREAEEYKNPSPTPTKLFSESQTAWLRETLTLVTSFQRVVVLFTQTNVPLTTYTNSTKKWQISDVQFSILWCTNQI